MGKQRITLAPGTPGFIGAKQNEEGAQINEDQQKEYWSGVGTLLYLTKHSRPDIEQMQSVNYPKVWMEHQSCNSEIC